MELQLEQLCTDRLRLAVPNRSRPSTELELGPSGGLVGTYVIDEDGHHLSEVVAAILRLTELTFLSGGVAVLLKGGESVDAQMDLDIPREGALRGSFRAKRLKLPNAEISNKSMRAVG